MNPVHQGVVSAVLNTAVRGDGEELRPSQRYLFFEQGAPGLEPGVGRHNRMLKQ